MTQTKGNVARYHPPDARIPETLQRTQSFNASGTLDLPSRQIHRDVDGRQKNQIARNPDDCDDGDRSNRTLKLR